VLGYLKLTPAEKQFWFADRRLASEREEAKREGRLREEEKSHGSVKPGAAKQPRRR